MSYELIGWKNNSEPAINAENLGKMDLQIKINSDFIEQSVTEIEANTLYANAIKKRISGLEAEINDASPNEHKITANLTSRNLLNIREYSTASDFYFEKISLTSTGFEIINGSYYLQFFPVLEVQKKYKFNVDIVSDILEDDSHFVWVINYKDGSISQKYSPSSFVLIEKEVNSISFYLNYSGTEKVSATLSNMYIFESGLIDNYNYTPYISNFSAYGVTKDRTIYKADANGNVYDLTASSSFSIKIYDKTGSEMLDQYPVIFNIEYNQDTNKASGGGSADLSNYYTIPEIDEKIGDIESALDGIIAIQDALIGGETV